VAEERFGGGIKVMEGVVAWGDAEFCFEKPSAFCRYIFLIFCDHL
jgi:hypothetical protein